MYSRVLSAAVQGINAFLVKVEVHLDSVLPAYTTVGLPDNAVRESRERVSAAIKNSGFLFPQKRITVNLAPAGIKKEGAAFDLPIALGILAATGQVSQDALGNMAILGELALDGNLRPIRGALPVAAALAEKRIQKFGLPVPNAEEAAMVEEIDVIPFRDLRSAVSFFNGETAIEPIISNPHSLFEEYSKHLIDFCDVRGQEGAKRALEIAAAGGHNVLMIGPPGSGKTMLAKRLPSILPVMNFEDAIEATKIYSVAGMLPMNQPLLSVRPFRNPHHTISDAGMIGGGQTPRPGEVSLAHKGVLFLDELPEFRKNVLEGLRQPLEDSQVTITRTKLSLTYPANFILIAAMNPCPCGYYGHPSRECRCSAVQVQKYLGHVSGPLLDRIDIHIEVPAVEYNDLVAGPSQDTSGLMRERVNTARSVQSERFRHSKNYRVNADMGTREIRKYCIINSDGDKLLRAAMDTMGLSARAYDRILKVARTIADLEDSLNVQPEHLAEAIQYRNLDRELWI